MKRNSKTNTNLLWIAAFILVVMMWIGIAPEWYSWYNQSWLQESLNHEPEKKKMWMQSLYELLNGRWLLNIPICVILGYFTFLWCRKISKDNDIRLYRPILVLMGIVLLFVHSQVDYAKVVCGLDFRVFLTILLGMLLLTMAIKLLKKWKLNIFIKISKVSDWIKEKSNMIINWITNICKKKGPNEKEEKEDEVTGFPIDFVDNEIIPENLKQYASIIVKKLLATKIDKQSFAVGITGEWGVGKSKFLDLLKERIKDNAEVVEFNPWMCRTPEQVTQDFFSSLRHQLSQKYSTLSKSIKEYAKLVGSLPITPHSIFSFDMALPLGKDSLFEKKQDLSEKFSNLPRPVVVFIDDMDRLEKEEVFEVLRLIRNTADLSNTIYLVAYDREYVSSVLETKNIKNASNYLEKIFPVEVHLPKVDAKQIWEALYKDIDVQDNVYKGNFAKQLYRRFDSDQRVLILRVLNTYRHAKRFSRLYMLNLTYLSKLYRNEIKLLDLFWLELLEMYDKCTYEKLANEPNCLLYYDKTKERYIIRGGIYGEKGKNDNNAYTGERFWQEETPNILYQLFSPYIETKKLSISRIENYDKYFTLSISPFRLSIREMNELFVDGVNPENIVKKWIGSGKYLSSIIYQMNEIDVNSLTNNKINAYICCILCLCKQVASNNDYYVWRVRKMLEKEKYNKKANIVHDATIEWIENKLKEDNALLFLSNLLNKLYLTIGYDEDGRMMGQCPLIINNTEVESLLVKVMKNHLENHPSLTALDVLNEKGELGKLFKNCCVMVEESIVIDNSCTYKQVSFDEIISHFSKKAKKPTIEEYEQAKGKMFFQEKPTNIDPEDEYDYIEFISESYDNKMDAYFGSSRKEKLERFKTECFVQDLE